jgi:hypothetical protein
MQQLEYDSLVNSVFLEYQRNPIDIIESARRSVYGE